MIILTKRLSASESKYKYVGLPKSIRDNFPEKDKIFKVIFKNKTYNMKVNNKNCIMLTQLYGKHLFIEDDELRIMDGKNRIFEFTVNQ